MSIIIGISILVIIASYFWLDRYLKKRRVQKTDLNKLTSLSSKYGPEIGLALWMGKFWYGTTMEQIMDAKGTPDNEYNKISETKTRVVLQYGSGHFEFEDKKLIELKFD